MDIKGKIFGLFFDIDGTVLGEDMNAYEESIAAIQKVRSLGHKCFVATGRATAYIPDFLNAEKNFDGVVSGAGTTIKIGDRLINEEYVPFEDVERFCEYTFKHKTPSILEGREHMYHFGNGEGIHHNSVHLDIADHWILVTEENYKDIITPDIQIEKFTVMGQLEPELDDVFGPNYHVFRHPAYGEAIQKKCGKDKAIQIVMDELGLPVSQSIAMGDSMNDYDMVKFAGFGVAMGQGSEELKKIADMVTDTANNAGVKVALKKIFNF